jgi:hypothetical protein
MRLLIVTHSYYPALTPRAFRWAAIAEALASDGHDVYVVCNKEIGTERSETINNVKVYRVGTNLREIFRSFLGISSFTFGISRSTEVSRQRLLTAVRAYIGKIIKWIYGHSVKKILWPDFSCFWYFPAVACASKLLEKIYFDVVVSVSLPFTDHCAGLELKKRFGKRWIVDIGDPFSFMSETPVNNHRLYSRLNYRVESEVLNHADAIAVTTDATKTQYLKHFPDLGANKISVIPPLFVVPTEVYKPMLFFADPNKTRLVFAGTLYSKIRNPSVLLELFSRLLKSSVGKNLELHFFGLINDCEPYFKKYQALIGVQVFLHGLVSRASAVSAMRGATILVNLGNSTAYQLPSKVVEYVMLGKPVLNIASQSYDSSQHFFSQINGVCSVSEEVLLSDMAELERVEKFIRNPPICMQADIDRLTKTYGLQSITLSYLQLFQGRI